MKSYWIVARDNKSVLEPREIPAPEPRQNEVVIKVHAAGLNRGELIVGGAVHGGPEKLGGNEASGVIVALGDGVTGWKVGDHVMGRARGSFAELAMMYTGQLMPKPPGLTWEEAAAVPSAFLTSYEAIVQFGGLQRGEWVLVTGASAGVGVGSILIAKFLGAKTIGTSGSAEKLEQLRVLGLDVGIHTRAPDFADAARKSTGGSGVNLAVNLTGGSLFPEIVRSLAHKGRVAIVGYMDGIYDPPMDLEQVHLRRLQIFGISNARQSLEDRFETTRGFTRDLLPALQDGRLRPVVDRVFAFDELPAAVTHMDSSTRVGKVIVKM